MANQRDTFAKRRREQELQQRARDKLARRAARKNDPGTGGPQIAWDEAVRYVESELPPTEAPGESKNDDDPPT
jgi:hypothetical protein